MLPIKEGGSAARGRSPESRATKAARQLAEATDKTLAKGQMRVQLGRFAQQLAEQRREARASARPASARAATVERKKVRSFDEIAEMAEAIDERDLPFGAALQKQRVSSAGDRRVRFGGQLVR